MWVWADACRRRNPPTQSVAVRMGTPDPLEAFTTSVETDGRTGIAGDQH